MPNSHSIKKLPPIAYLRACFKYYPDTGKVYWKRRPLEHFSDKHTWSMWNKQNAGKIAGSFDARGYRRISIENSGYKTHRIIFKLITNKEPPSIIDHRDGDKANNRWDNLRPATQTQSNWNAVAHADSKCGKRGVSFNQGKWQSYIKANGVRHYVGRFDTVEEASAAYEMSARKLHGKFHRQQGET